MSDLLESSRVWGVMGGQGVMGIQGVMGGQGVRALGVQHLCSHGDLALICSPSTGTGGEHMGWVIG